MIAVEVTRRLHVCHTVLRFGFWISTHSEHSVWSLNDMTYMENYNIVLLCSQVEILLQLWPPNCSHSFSFYLLPGRLHWGPIINFPYARHIHLAIWFAMWQRATVNCNRDTQINEITVNVHQYTSIWIESLLCILYKICTFPGETSIQHHLAFITHTGRSAVQLFFLPHLLNEALLPLFFLLLASYPKSNYPTPYTRTHAFFCRCSLRLLTVLLPHGNQSVVYVHSLAYFHFGHWRVEWVENSSSAYLFQQITNTWCCLEVKVTLVSQAQDCIAHFPPGFIHITMVVLTKQQDAPA